MKVGLFWPAFTRLSSLKALSNCVRCDTSVWRLVPHQRRQVFE
jgi:hypothetical protein